jgi:hypothetical protein
VGLLQEIGEEVGRGGLLIIIQPTNRQLLAITGIIRGTIGVL